LVGDAIGILRWETLNKDWCFVEKITSEELSLILNPKKLGSPFKEASARRRSFLFLLRSLKCLPTLCSLYVTRSKNRAHFILIWVSSKSRADLKWAEGSPVLWKAVFTQNSTKSLRFLEFWQTHLFTNGMACSLLLFSQPTTRDVHTMQ
jgi:hypothetical protein